jgi:hypothetical protein
MNNWVEKVVLKWTAEDVEVNDAASMDDIVWAERALDFKFPNDFKELYLTINGFKDHEWQEHLFFFWSLKFLVEEFNSSNDKNFVGFCDYLIASHYIGFRKDKPGIFKMYSVVENEPIAQTFEEVVTMINSNSALIY